MVFVSLVVATAAGDLYTAGRPLVQYLPRETAQARPSVCDFLPDHAPGLHATVWWGSDWLRPPPGFPREHTKTFDIEAIVPNIAAPHCAHYANGYEALRLSQHTDLVSALSTSYPRLFDILGVEYLVLDLPPTAYGKDYPLVTREERFGMAVYRAGGLPYAHTVARVENARNGRAAIARLADPAFDYRHAAVLEGAAAAAGDEAAARRAEVTHFANGRVTIAADYQAPGHLVVLESFYPGWVARIDGHETRIYRANAAFIGLEVPSGGHEITLTFDPSLQRTADAVSAAALAATVILLACGAYLSRRQARRT